MTIERVATSTQSQTLMSQVMQAQATLDNTQSQVASGLVSTTYSGIGDKTAALEAAQSASDRTTAYQSATNLALNQVNLQDTQLSSLSDLANQWRSDVTNALGNGDASTLMTQAQSIFDQAST